MVGGHETAGIDVASHRRLLPERSVPGYAPRRVVFGTVCSTACNSPRARNPKLSKAQEIDPFWSWIPAFRAVAEHQSLSQAAESLGVSRSALSRTIRLLEQAVGSDLFRRSGRSLQLNREGESFLDAVRLGMRVVHEGYKQVQSREPSGKMVISSSGPCLHLLQPVLLEAGSIWPKLTLEVLFVPPPVTNARLLRGEIDLALLADPVPGEEVQLEMLGPLHHGVFCGPNHPLYRKPEVGPEEVLEHPFVAPPVNAVSGDPWPPSLSRDIGLRVHQLSLALEVCQRGELLGVFPTTAVKRSPWADKLWQIPFDVVPSFSAYAVRRVDVAEHMPAARILDRIRYHMAHEASGVGDSPPE